MGKYVFFFIIRQMGDISHFWGGGGGLAFIAFPSPSFFPLLPNQIILFQLLKLFRFVCNGKVIIFRFVFL